MKRLLILAALLLFAATAVADGAESFRAKIDRRTGRHAARLFNWASGKGVTHPCVRIVVEGFNPDDGEWFTAVSSRCE